MNQQSSSASILPAGLDFDSFLPTNTTSSITNMNSNASSGFNNPLAGNDLEDFFGGGGVGGGGGSVKTDSRIDSIPDLPANSPTSV